MISFGPIPSRRLGKSLGINNIASGKECSYSCVYCQIGNTNHKSISRKSYYEPDKIVKDVETRLTRLDPKHKPDYFTVVPNGEPSLDCNLGRLINQLKEFGIPVAVITNASLIDRQDVRDDLLEADWISVKIDTIEHSAWHKINRPAKEVVLENILHGLLQFAAVYKGKLNTETMLVEGYNDSTDMLQHTAAFIARLKPIKAWLSIPVRPPAIRDIKPASHRKITEAWYLFQDAGNKTELLTGFEGTDTGTTGNAFEDILSMTAVHPLREDALSELLRLDHSDHSIIHSLLAQRLIRKINYKGKPWYVRNYNY